MLFTIIIPTLDEEKNVTGCFESIEKNDLEGTEIIVVDGGSSDKTLETIKAYDISIPVNITRSEKASVASQLDLGTKMAEGKYLIFLHADCRLPPDALKDIKTFFKKYPEGLGGAFEMIVNGDRFFYRIFSFFGNLFCRITKIFFGDRAMFITSRDYKRLGGFKDIPIMSDVEFSRRMRSAGIVKLLKGPVLSDSRKFDEEPFWKMIYLQLWAHLMFDMGKDIEMIERKYYYNKY